MTIKSFLKENKEGMTIGAIVGAVAAYLWKSTGHDMTFVLETQGVVDSFLPSDPVILGFYKVLILFIILGIAVGAIIDMNLREGWL